MLNDKVCKAYNREKPARVSMEDISFSYFIFFLYSKLNFNCKSPEQMAEWCVMPDGCVLTSDAHEHSTGQNQGLQVKLLITLGISQS